MKKLIIFHPSPNLVGIIDQLLAKLAPGLDYKNVVVPYLLNQAIQEGITDRIREEIEKTISKAATDDNSLVLCTCSTLGECAETAGLRLGKQVIRIDRPMAEEAVKMGQRIGVAAAVKSTIDPTKKLLEEVAGEEKKKIEITEIFCEKAWSFKERG